MTRSRRPLPYARLLLLAGGVAVGVAVAEAGLRWQGILPDYSWEWQGTVFDMDPHVLYKFRGHSRHDINRLGFRDYEFDHDKGDRRRFLMIGDSFQFGDNVEAEQTLAKALEQRLGAGTEVFNLGVPGYGPDQSYEQLLQVGLALDPDVVILSIFAGNDFNDLAKNQLYVEDPEGHLVFNPRNPVAQVIPRFRMTAMLRRALTGTGLDPKVRDELTPILGGDRYDVLIDPESESSRHKIRLMRGILRLFEDTLKSNGIDFYVFIIPSEENIQNHQRFLRWRIPKEAYFNNERIAQKLCEEEGLAFVSLQVPFLRHLWQRLYTAGNGHLSLAGIELATAHVVSLLEGRRVFGVGGSGQIQRRRGGKPTQPAAPGGPGPS